MSSIKTYERSALAFASLLAMGNVVLPVAAHAQSGDLAIGNSVGTSVGSLFDLSIGASSCDYTPLGGASASCGVGNTPNGTIFAAISNGTLDLTLAGSSPTSPLLSAVSTGATQAEDLTFTLTVVATGTTVGGYSADIVGSGTGGNTTHFDATVDEPAGVTASDLLGNTTEVFGNTYTFAPTTTFEVSYDIGLNTKGIASGTTLTLIGGTTLVPEPLSATILASGVAALGMIPRRRRRNSTAA